MSQPLCHCGKVTSPVYSLDQCRRCWKLAYDPRYRAAVLGQPQMKIEWTSTCRLVADAIALAGKLPPNICGIAGIPRSGMIPASVIATHLHLPLFELPARGALRSVGSGSRGSLGWAGDRAGPLVVVDDTVFNGAAMGRAKEQMRGRQALFAAVYPTPWTTGLVDHYARTLGSIQLLEWNLFNNGIWSGRSQDPAYRAGVATDFDGILCRDPDVPDADGGAGLERYERWLQRAVPRWLPRAFPIRLIVTGRLERWRQQTEAWLRKWGVRWERLVMHPAATASERDQRGDVAAMKAREYSASDCGFFLESDPMQAERIFRITRKAVVCPCSEMVWY